MVIESLSRHDGGHSGRISFAYLSSRSFLWSSFFREWRALNLLPSGATNAMLIVTSPVLFATDDPFPWWQGALVLAAWCLLPAAIGVLSTVRRDVS